jgi:LysM domain
LSTSLKGPLGMLIAGLVALSLASFLGAALPPEAQAQNTSGASTQEAQQQNNNITSETAVPPAPVVVEPGDSLWAIAQERLGAGASPEQVAEEVERIHALNRGRIADDPNLLFPGQELRLAAPGAQEAPATPQPAAPEPAATEPVAEPSTPEPMTAELEPVSESPAAVPAVVPEEQEPSVVEPAADVPEEQQPADQQPVAEEPVSQEPAEGRSAAPAPNAEQEAAEPGALAQAPPEEPQDVVAAGAQRELDDAQGRRLLGFGILALTLIAAILGVWRLFVSRPAGGDPGARGTPPTSVDHHASPNGANGRGEARGPALVATAERARHLGEPRSRTSFAHNKPYVDRTGMAVLARPKRREAPRRRRPHVKAKFSPDKRRPRSARDPQVRHLLRGGQTNGAHGRVPAENRSNGGGR